MAVHDVDMDPVGAGGIDRAHFLAQFREIGGQDRRGDHERAMHRGLIGTEYSFQRGSPNTPCLSGQRTAPRRRQYLPAMAGMRQFVFCRPARSAGKAVALPSSWRRPRSCIAVRSGRLSSIGAAGASRSVPCLRLADRTATIRLSSFRRCGSGDNRKAARHRAMPRRNRSPQQGRKTRTRRPRRPPHLRASRRRLYIRRHLSALRTADPANTAGSASVH